MHDGEFGVDILDKNGHIVDSKLRKEIVKGQDIYHAVYCVIATPSGEIILNKIAQREDMPNLHAGKLGCSCATIRRTGESSEEAALRAVRNELHLDSQPELLAEKMVEIDGTYRKIGWYLVSSEMPKEFNHEDIEELISINKEDLEELYRSSSERLTPPLKMFWGIMQTTN